MSLTIIVILDGQPGIYLSVQAAAITERIRYSRQMWGRRSGSGGPPLGYTGPRSAAAMFAPCLLGCGGTSW